MKKYVQLIFLMSDWSIDPRKHLTREIIKVTDSWSDTVLIQLPVSLFVHTFTKFKIKIWGWIKGKYKTVTVEDTAVLFTPVILFHYNLWLKFGFLAFIDVILLKCQLNKFLKNRFSGRKIILWLYYPNLYSVIDKIKHDFLVYDLQDNYDYNGEGVLLRTEAHYNSLVIEKSGLVICTAKALYKRAVKCNKNSLLVQNGNRYEIFSSQTDNQKENELSLINKPIIGYLGGIKKLLDFELLTQLIVDNPNCYFVFIGLLYKDAEFQFEQLLKYNNVIWIKFKEPEELPGYVRKFNVGILPFKINKFTEGVFPNKFLEYMAAGIPIVSTALPDLEEYSSIIGFSKDYIEFKNKLASSLSGEFDKYLHQYLLIAKENSWYKKAKMINFELLKKLLK